jgi:hypothetical protein
MLCRAVASLALCVLAGCFIDATLDAKGGGTIDQPYFTVPIPLVIRKRVGWLSVLFLSEMLTATVPGLACANTCHSRVFTAMPDAMISEARLYWFPTSPSMFSQFGLLASAGGFSGS